MNPTLCEGLKYVRLPGHELCYVPLGIHSMMLKVQETEKESLADGCSTQLGERQQTEQLQ